METKKENKQVNKKGKMVKRQISIITVFLWIFLVTTMVTITTSSIRKNNSIVEIDDENWNVSLVMYDKSSDTPEQAITDFTWNAETDGTSSRVLCMQINYNCTTGKAYQPGELVIEIPGIGKDSFSEYWRNYNRGYNNYKTYYDYWLNENITIAADKVTDVTKKYDWSYSYDEEKNIYIFTNNGTIEENEHFEGTIQIVYNLEPKLRIQTDLEYKAKFKENIANIDEIIAKWSNVCNFHYTSNKKEYTLKTTAKAGAKVDYTKIEGILDDYYWVQYMYNSSENGVIKTLDENDKEIYFGGISNSIKLNLPEGAVIYDENLNKIDAKENNTYYYLIKSGNMTYDFRYYYIGYPKSKYNEGDTITHTAEVWGRYEDEEEMQKLAEASSTVSLVAFDFEYKGKLYSITKSDIIGDLKYVNQVKNKIRS